MADSNTLLAHMILSLTNQVEVAATKALAFILTKSDDAMEAFNDLVRNATGTELSPVKRVAVEVEFTAVDGSEGRLDLVGYDAGQENRVIVEAKFGARLLEGQGGGYLNQLSRKGATILMFLVPDYRVDVLWNEVIADVRGGGISRFDQVENPGQIKCLRVDSGDRYLMIVSWRQLLEEIRQKAGDNLGIQSDIHQLRGLTERMDMEEFRPLQKGEYGDDFARRMRDLRRIYDGVIAELRDRHSDITEGLSTSGQPETGYGRYLRLSGKEVWFGIFYDLWIDEAFAQTPFWLNLYSCDARLLERIRTEADLRPSVNSVLRDPVGKYFPICVKPNVSLGDVIVDMVGQIYKIGDAIEKANAIQ